MKSKIQKTLSIPLNISLKKILKAPFKPFIDKIKLKKEKQIIDDYLNNLFNNKVNYFDLQFDFFVGNKIIPNNVEIQNICSHYFDLLGSGLVKVAFNTTYNGFLGFNYSTPLIIAEHDDFNELLPREHKDKSKILRTFISSGYESIDWFVDFRSGYRWSLDYYKHIKYGNKEGVDIKVPWELARLQHLFDLSLCCRFVDNNQKSALKQEIVNQLFDFISHNPPFHGPNWISPMEVSIRSVNIIFSLFELKRNKLDIDHEVLQHIYTYLWACYRYLLLNNEWNDGLRNNHYMANLLGLTLLSKFFEQDKLSNIYDKLYIKFRTELQYQFFDDGGNFEGSLPYHFFSFEIIFWLTEFFKDKLKDDIQSQERLSDILNFNNTFNNYSIENIQIGDNDSGKILSFNCLINCNYNFIVLSNILRKHIVNNNITQYKKSIFNDFGIIILKQEQLSLILSIGRKAQSGKGGHNHNDSQSFILLYDDEPFVVDPGTFVYTASAKYRNLFRSAEYHNKVCEFASNDLNEDYSSLFWFNDKKLDYFFHENESKKFVEIENKKLSIKRSISIDNIEVIINDIIEKEYNNLISSFHLHPNCKVEVINPKHLRILNNKKELHFHSSHDINIEDYSYSPEYGKFVKSKKIVIYIKNRYLRKLQYTFKIT